jgi:hypothetical protein
MCAKRKRSGYQIYSETALVNVEHIVHQTEKAHDNTQDGDTLLSKLGENISDKSLLSFSTSPKNGIILPFHDQTKSGMLRYQV